MKRTFAIVFCVLNALNLFAGPPPFHSNDPAVQGNFEDIYNQMSSHMHDGNGTSELGGISGVTDGSDASAGDVGEYVESIAGGSNYPATGNYGDLTSISLTAGDWDVTGQINAGINGATWSAVYIGISVTSGNSGTGLVFGSSLDTNQWDSSAVRPTASSLVIPSLRMSLASTTTVYLKYRALYAAGTPQTNGGKIAARRVR